MASKVIACKKLEASDTEFWKAMDIWISNPHAVNRRILVFSSLLTMEIRSNVNEVIRRATCFDLTSVARFNEDEDILSKVLLDALDLNPTNCHRIDDATTSLVESCSENEDSCCLRVRKILPRNPRLFSLGVEFTFADRRTNRVLTLHRSCHEDKRNLGPSSPYEIRYGEDGCVSMSIYCDDSCTADSEVTPCIEWLRSKLFPRLLHWMRTESSTVRSTPVSLSLVSPVRYAAFYDRLKNKYGPEMVKIWTENTDPAKYVYEDVAIAAYLLTLWEKERSENRTDKLQSFLDLGCGNGLLVHILSSEGYPGTGFDLRKRKIWDLYPNNANLQVRPIVPSSETTFPGVDWIIGNHSDELTPWIPVIAARSSADCRFFLLPCCAYEFDGTKYRRQCASKSQYSEYIEYVKNVSEQCGFKTDLDRLRIPSTKRICLIGSERTISDSDSDSQDRERKIQSLISSRARSLKLDNSQSKRVSPNDSAWTCDFRLRRSVELVRNCTKLEKSLIGDIVNRVAVELLRDGRKISVNDVPDKLWNAGRRLPLDEIVRCIPPDMLKQLRNECGGIQTLLKNHRHVFSVMQGKVEFRVPGCADQSRNERVKKRAVNSRIQIKVKPCWFHENHPDGCPIPAIRCKFNH